MPKKPPYNIKWNPKNKKFVVDNPKELRKTIKRRQWKYIKKSVLKNPKDFRKEIKKSDWEKYIRYSHANKNIYTPDLNIKRLYYKRKMPPLKEGKKRKGKKKRPYYRSGKEKLLNQQRRINRYGGKKTGDVKQIKKLQLKKSQILSYLRFEILLKNIGDEQNDSDYIKYTGVYKDIGHIPLEKISGYTSPDNLTYAIRQSLKYITEGKYILSWADATYTVSYNIGNGKNNPTIYTEIFNPLSPKYHYLRG